MGARFIAFESDAGNLVPGDTNGRSDVFVHDRLTGPTERVSVGPNGRQADGGSFSARLVGDRPVVAFSSEASNLVPGDTNGEFRRVRPRPSDGQDRAGGASVPTDAGRQLSARSPRCRPNGRLVAFGSAARNSCAGDTNGQEDIFVRAR